MGIRIGLWGSRIFLQVGFKVVILGTMSGDMSDRNQVIVFAVG